MVQRWFFRMFGENFLRPDFLTQGQIIANNFEIFIRFLGHGNIQAGAIVQQHLGNKFGIQVEAFQAAFLVVLDIQQYLDAAAEFLEHVHAAHGARRHGFAVAGQIWGSASRTLPATPGARNLFSATLSAWSHP